MRRTSLLSSNLRSALVPKLDLRCVCALRQIDVNEIALAVGPVIFAKLLTQAGRPRSARGDRPWGRTSRDDRKPPKRRCSPSAARRAPPEFH